MVTRRRVPSSQAGFGLAAESGPLVLAAAGRLSPVSHFEASGIAAHTTCTCKGPAVAMGGRAKSKSDLATLAPGGSSQNGRNRYM